MTEFNNIIQKKLNVFENIINNIQTKISSLEIKINNLEDNFKLVTNIKLNSDDNENIVQLKKESINIENNIVKKALIYKDYRTILYLFKYYYRNKTNVIHKYPIRIKSKRVYEYYNNSTWIIDNNGHYIKNTLFMNIQTILFKYNNMDNIDDLEDLYNNQIFINKLSEDKYKRDLFKHIIDEINN